MCEQTTYPSALTLSLLSAPLAIYAEESSTTSDEQQVGNPAANASTEIDLLRRQLAAQKAINEQLQRHIETLETQLGSQQKAIVVPLSLASTRICRKRSSRLATMTIKKPSRPLWARRGWFLCRSGVSGFPFILMAA